MRTATIEINGKSYLLCFSARVIRACTERYGDVSALADALDAEDPVKRLDEAVWVLSQMMDAGARYAKLNGIETPPPLPPDGILDQTDLSDFFRLRMSIKATITSGQAKHVEVEPSKNGAATPGTA